MHNQITVDVEVGALGGCSFSHSCCSDEFDFTTIVKLIEAVLLKDPFKSLSFLLMLSFLVFFLSCCLAISVSHCHNKVALVTEFSFIYKCQTTTKYVLKAKFK